MNDKTAARGGDRVQGISRRSLLLVLSSPSGAGKTSVARELLRREDELVMSISVTTRRKRPGENDGEDYRFVAESDYHRMVEAGELLEHAKVFGNFYGTPRGPVDDALAAGKDVLFDVDWQGTQQLMEHEHYYVVRVFILPPSIAELESRLRARAQDPEDVVRSRMNKAADEMSHYTEYDYIVVNHDIGDSVDEVQTILRAERLKRANLVGLHQFVDRLRGAGGVN